MKDILLHPFAFGLYIGLALWVIAYYHLLRLKSEHTRYKRMLGDKMEIEAAAVSKLKQELDAAKKENENLRIKVQTQNESGDHRLVRDLEIYARAEKKMMIAAPGFASPWEQAKQASNQEIADEDTGKSPPKRFFQRFFGSTTEQPKALPPQAEATKAS
jgi:hypothetical protein